MPATGALCPLCDRERLPRRPPVCDACRSSIARIPADIRDGVERLAADPDPVPDDGSRPWQPAWAERLHAEALADRKRRQSAGAELRDALAAEGLVPPAPQPRSRIPASHDEPAAVLPSTARLLRQPLDVERVDILLPARNATRALHARGLLGDDPDQVGSLSLRTTLDTWVRAWARLRRESPPPARTGPMLGWLRRRVDWACDVLDWQQVRDFAAELRDYRSAIRGLLGEVETVDWKVGVGCPACKNMTLYRQNGSDYVECDSCPNLLTVREYLDRARVWVGCGPCRMRIAVGLAAAQPAAA